MARISVRIQEIVSRCIPSGLSTKSNYYDDILIEHPFSNILRVKKVGNSIEIPMFIRDIVERKLIDDRECNEILIPLNVQKYYPRQIKTPEVAIKNIFDYISPLCMLDKVKCGNEVYIGTKGILLNSNFDILFMPVLTGIINDYKVTYTGVKIYINPCTTYSINKTESIIFSKLIPCIVANGVFVEKPFNSMGEYSFNTYSPIITPEVSILDITNRFIIKPRSNELPNEDNIENILENSIDDIIRGICP